MNARTIALGAAAAMAAGAFVVTTLIASAAPAEAATRKFHPTMAMSTSHVTTGSPVTIKGKVNLYRGASRKVYLQYRYHENGTTKWKTLRSLKTSKSGSYSTTTHPSNSRDRDYRIYKPAGKAKKGYSKTLHLSVDPVITTKTTTVPFAVTQQLNPDLSMCTRNVLVQGANGSTTYTYLDGKLDSSRTVSVAPINRVEEVGSSTVPCISSWKPGKSLEGSPVSITVAGRNLAGATAATFGDQPGTVATATDTNVSVNGPALAAGTVPVALTISGTEVPVGDFTVFPKPSIASIDLASGSLSGGETITITGTTLGSTSKVTFTAKGDSTNPLDKGPVFSAKFTVVDDQTVKVTAPAAVGGTADIDLVTDYGTVSTSYLYKTVSRDGSTLERQILDEVNKRRLSGVTCGSVAVPPAPALSWDGQVSDLARSHVADIDARYQLYIDTYPTFVNWHGTPGLPNMLWRFVLAGMNGETYSEILARTNSDSAAAHVVDGWVDSPAHCQTLMSPSYTRAGVGAVQHRGDDSLLSVVDFQ